MPSILHKNLHYAMYCEPKNFFTAAAHAAKAHPELVK